MRAESLHRPLICGRPLPRRAPLRHDRRVPWPPDPLHVNHPDRLVTDATVGRVAITAMVREATVDLLWGETFHPHAESATPSERSAAVAHLVAARCAVTMAAALWIWLGTPAPRRVDVMVQPRHRRPDPHPRRTPHEGELPTTDWALVGTTRVCLPERAAADLARFAAAADAVPLLRLAAGRGLDLTAVAGRLRRCAGRPGSAAGLLAVTAAAGHAEPWRDLRP